MKVRKAPIKVKIQCWLGGMFPKFIIINPNTAENPRKVDIILASRGPIYIPKILGLAAKNRDMRPPKKL